MLHITNRPDKFSGMVGNRSLIKSLSALLINKDRPHSYLFYGPSGCGKTTLARIMCNKLECVQIDLRELNCADYTGVDNAREIIQQMRLAPMVGKVRCWIIDEAHRLSGSAQDALLKALEDTPGHVYFFLCTTNPNKLLPTIKSRCTPCEVKPLKEEELIGLLKSIPLDAKIPDRIYEEIAEKSNGQPRFALVQLDAIKDLSSKDMKNAIKSFEQDKEITIKLCRLMLKGESWKKACVILKELVDEEPENIRRQILGYCGVALLNGNEKAAAIMGNFTEPYYDSGKYGLYLSCYDAIKGE